MQFICVGRNFGFTGCFQHGSMTCRSSFSILISTHPCAQGEEWLQSSQWGKSAVFTSFIASILSKSISIGLLRAWSQTGKWPVRVSMLGEGPEKDWEEQCRPLFPWPGLTPLSLLREDTGPIDWAVDIFSGWAKSPRDKGTAGAGEYIHCTHFESCHSKISNSHTVRWLHDVYVNMYWSSLRMDLKPGSEVKESARNVGDMGLIPGLGRSPGEENGNPLQYSCLENPMDRGAWWATVHRVAKSRIGLSDFTFTFTFHTCKYGAVSAAEELKLVIWGSQIWLRLIKFEGYIECSLCVRLWTRERLMIQRWNRILTFKECTVKTR